MDEDRIRQQARQYYTEDLPYHNFEHVQDARAFAGELLDRCDRHGIAVNRDAVIAAVYFHDAGYHHDHQTAGFDSKEAYSAHIAEEELADLGTDTDVITTVKDCILATQQDADFTTPEEKIVRAADLAQIAADYATFRENAEQLREEYEQLHDDELSQDEWRQMVKDTVGFYLQQDIHLTPEHDWQGDISAFHAKARRNLEQFLEETGDSG